MTENLQSGVSTSPADALLGNAIARALKTDPAARGDLFAGLLHDIAAFMKEHPEERPWTYTEYTGTDGSRIFRGGTGHSLVVDTAGRMWRARSLEDFETEYEIANNDCRITALTPLYHQMREYLPLE